jgi:hypothetical protein
MKWKKGREREREREIFDQRDKDNKIEKKAA